MAASDPWKRYLDTGMELTNLTRDRAEKIVKDFVKAGEVQREHAQQRVEDLLDRSRKMSSALAETVRAEVTRQLTDLGLIPQSNKKATKTVADAVPQSGQTASAGTAKAAGTKKAAAKKVAKKATAATKKTTGTS